MTDSAARLDPFVLLARSTKGAAAAKVIMDATAAAGVYAFAELLELQNIEALQSDASFAKHHLLLQLFAYGTLAEYTASTDSYPPLTPIHLVKLKQVTLVSLALQHRSLHYEQLQQALQIDTIRELEDLIIDVIYAGLLGAKMHHYEKVLHVDWAAGRDLRPDDLVSMQARLSNWCATADSLLTALDKEIHHLRSVSTHEANQLSQYRAQRDEQYARYASAIIPKEKDDRGGSKRGGTRGSAVNMTGDDVLAGVMGGRMGGARSVGQPDELAGLRSSKRFKDVGSYS